MHTVRHDGERVNQEIAANLQWVQELLVHFQQPMEQSAFMDRMVRFFNKEKKVNEKTLDIIKTVKNKPVEGIRTVVRELSSQENKGISKG